MKKILNAVLSLCLVAAFAAQPAWAAPAAAQPEVSQAELMRKVRKELVTLPYYGVFDNLEYGVEGGVVTLYGQVVRPSTRSDAARRVARLRGVERVVNNIEVLPLGGFDDTIRRQTYRALFGWDSPLFRYGRASVSLLLLRADGAGGVDAAAGDDAAFERVELVGGVDEPLAQLLE